MKVPDYFIAEDNIPIVEIKQTIIGTRQFSTILCRMDSVSRVYRVNF
jgi:hypothetical protein